MNKFQYRRAMMALGLNQQTFADKIGVTRRTSNGYANGTAIPDRVVSMIEMMLREHARVESGQPDAVVTLSRRPVQIVRGRPAAKPTKPLAPTVQFVSMPPGTGKTKMVKQIGERFVTEQLAADKPKPKKK